MYDLLDNPEIVFVLSFFTLWLSVWIGASYLRRRRKLEENVREDLGVILAATLTLLGLIIGFSFSMAISRYDQRKNYEEAEANAIGTEYVGPTCCLPPMRRRVRALLRNYLDQRILFYTTRDEQQLRRSMPAPLNCRPSCGPRSWLRPQRSQHPSSPWPFRA